MNSKKKTVIITIMAIAVGGFVCSYQLGYLFPDYLTIFHAGSLLVPMQKLGEEFSREYPRIRLAYESSGSVDAVRKITDLHRSCDVLASADYNLVPQMMYEDYANWTVIFASNEMVIAYTNGSKHSNEIDSMNWYEVLSREDVVVGRSESDCDPCGYRALMLFQLASIYYSDTSINTTLWEHTPTVIRPKSVQLLEGLESGVIDYAFEYKSVAVQHGLNYVELPDEINLSNWTQHDYYTQVNVTIQKGDDKMIIAGAPILYGVTIPKNAEHTADAKNFIKFLLSEDGRNIIKECGQNPIYPAYTDHPSTVPSELRDLVKQLQG